ncbi:MAG: HAMP domain-containing sensor histidine kinase [Pseudomonadota bacterium]
MLSLDKVEEAYTGPDPVPLLVQQMRDYCQVGIDLVIQRQVIFLAALALAAFYYSATLAVTLLTATILLELFDFWLFRRILRTQNPSPARVRQHLLLLVMSTVLSATIICSYAIAIAVIQGPTTHFMPLFFLFAAALFAAMNNHQLLPVLVLRMIFYGATFLFIPIRDVVITGAALQSELWAQLFSSIFVLFFILDCSRLYLNLYRSQLAQLRALKEEHERAKVAYTAKTAFVSTMSHELRTPLTAIKGSIDMVNSGALGKLTDQAGFAIKVAQRNCDRLLCLINEILDLQSVETNKMKFTIEPVDLIEIAETAVTDNTPYAKELDVVLVANFPSEGPKVRVDRKRIGQVLANVLSNASKFSPKDSQVRIWVEDDAEVARILVSDMGIGLSQDDYEEVFGSFSQIDSSDTRKIGGTGLGMNISKRIMEELGGDIRYVGNEGAGTTFIVEMPKASAAELSQPRNELATSA